MLCKKCKKEVPDAPFCCLCGKRQEVEKRTIHRRARGSGSITVDKRNHNAPYTARTAPPAVGLRGVYLGSYPTRKAAQAALDAFAEGKVTELYNITLKKVYEMWSELHFPTLTDSGRTGYTSAFTDLAPLHGRKMRELKTADFQRCVDTVAAKYSRSKCEKVRQLCSQLCKYAMQNDVMDKNYAAFLTLPKEDKKEKVTFTAAERETLWEHKSDNRARLVLALIYMGFRIGEIAELKPADVHLDDGYVIGGIKTKAGKNRVIPFPPSIPEINGFFRDWLAVPESSPLGLHVNTLRQFWFYPCLAELGMIAPPIYNPKNKKYEYKDTRLTPHAARHTFASLSAAAGMRPDALQKIIGHADYATTAEVYVHKNVETLRTEMSKLTK